jgi:hypothetical protein
MLNDMAATTVALVPRVPAESVDELLEGASERWPLPGTDGKSGATLEGVMIRGDRFVVKHLHPDGDWTMRGFGDLQCRPVAVWTTGILDALPACIDHAVVGAAAGLGRNGWGGALLLRDVSNHLVPEGDDLLTLEVHRQLLDHLAVLAVAFWGADGVPPLLPLGNRCTAFGPGWLAVEAALGWPEAVPRLAVRGWEAFGRRAPADVVDIVEGLRHDPGALTNAMEGTPQTFLHGDWKLGNLGAHAGRTILLDWTYPGIGPVAHDLAWYLALNRARLPESKEDAIEAFATALRSHGIATEPWWEAQLGLALLGALVQFGWEKALGDDAELAWWCERARAGAVWLA